MSENKKNILVLSVNTWNDEGGSNTLQNLFKNFNPKNIYSLYARSDLPNSYFCSHFYQISEINLLKKIFNNSVNVGSVVNSKNKKGNTITIQENKIKKIYKSNNNSLLKLFRELLWLTNTWKEDKLEDYIRNANVDSIFVLVSSFIYSNKIALYAKELAPRAKLVLYFVDDNYTYKASSKSFFAFIHRYFLRKTLNKLVSQSSNLFVISSKMKKEYDFLFKKKSTLLTKGVRINEIIEYPLNNDKIKLLYVGNLEYGRFEEIMYLANCVNETNKKFGNSIQFDIYTQTEQPNHLIEKFNSFKNCKINNAIPYSQVKDLQTRYDILLYVESFKNKNVRATRLSFSTKVTDYLSSGKPIWAIGPEEIASIEYFKKNNCAFVTSSRNIIKNDLENIVKYPQNLNDYIKNAIGCCKLYHDEDILSKRFMDIMK